MNTMTYRGYEMPPYTVESRDGDFEIRHYAPAIVAEVTLPGSRDAALRAGFRHLAGYIFGGNLGAAKVAMTSPVEVRPGAKIAMTSPVAQTGSDGSWTVRFTMPSGYTLETLPVPKDRLIVLRESPGERLLVLMFSGLAGQAKIAKQEVRLRSYVVDKGLRVSGALRISYYDDPLTFPWNRRNEVALALG